MDIFFVHENLQGTTFLVNPDVSRTVFHFDQGSIRQLIELLEHGVDHRPPLPQLHIQV